MLCGGSDCLWREIVMLTRALSWDSPLLLVCSSENVDVQTRISD